MRILACGAHPDDVEIACGGTVALAAGQGHDVQILDLTRGEMGSNGDARLRGREATAAAAILGVAARHNADLPDGRLDSSSESQKQKLVSIIRSLRPQMMIIPPQETRHPDHGQASRLLADAAFLSGLALFPAEGEPHRPQLILRTLERKQAAADFCICIDEQIEKKREALWAYRSQFSLEEGGRRTEINSPAFLEGVLARDRYFGSLSGCVWAEPFSSTKLLAFSDLGPLLGKGQG